MLRSAIGKVMWVGRATVFLVGLAVILALVFGVASMAFADNGQPFLLGRLTNTATSLTRLVGNVDGSAMQVVNNNAGTNDSALSLSVQSGEAPMRVNSTTKVANLNVDKVDNVSLKCPSGTRFHEGVCIELALRGTFSTFDSAQTDCLNEPRTRLPTPGELQTLEGRTLREWTNHTYQDFDTTTQNLDIAVNSDGTLTTLSTSNNNAYRCVKLPS